MSDLTPEAARAAAEWLDARYAGAIDTTPLVGAGHLHAEADRLESAAKTLGQVLAESLGHTWVRMAPQSQRTYAISAAAVIDHHVGPDRVVVDRAVVLDVLVNGAVLTRSSKHLRGALS